MLKIIYLNFTFEIVIKNICDKYSKKHVHSVLICIHNDYKYKTQQRKCDLPHRMLLKFQYITFNIYSTILYRIYCISFFSFGFIGG